MSVSPAAPSVPDTENAQNSALAATNPPRGLGGALIAMSSFIGRMRWPIFCLFQLGVICGFLAIRSQTVQSTSLTGSHPEPSVKSEPSRDLIKEQSQAFPVREIERGDQLLREGRFEMAYATYCSVGGMGGGEIPPLLRYRMALCLESLGRWDAAIAEFNSVRMAGATPVYEVAAQLGQIRVWMRKGQMDEAKHLLCDLLLRSGSSEFQGRPFLAETVHRLARLMAQEVMNGDKPGPLNPQAISHAMEESKLEHVLDWISMIDVRSDSEEVPFQTPFEVEPESTNADQMMVHGSLNRASVLEVLQQLAESCGRRCLPTPEAQRQLSNRTVALTIGSLPLSTVLTGITEPLGILWEVNADAIRFCGAGEVTREALSMYRFRYAERALADALERYPAYRLRDVAHFELANLDYARGKYQAAADRYEKLATSVPRSPVAIEASYNLGLSMRRLGNNDSAREAFYRVIDGSPNHFLASLASLTIGRMYLDQAEFERAIPSLRRAAAFAAGTDVVPVSALLLTSAHLLMDNADAANAILTDHREVLTEPRYRNVTAFLGSYARMLGSGGRRQAQREGRVLTWAIVGASRESILGSTGVLLMGQAYRELGLGEKMVELYQRALHEGVPPALEPPMWFDMAEQSLIAGDMRAAIHGFTNLAARGSGKWNRLARIRLAEIALDDGRVEDCLDSCRSLLEPRDSSDTTAVLQLMGRAFEQAGVHQKAAACFAGQLPEF